MTSKLCSVPEAAQEYARPRSNCPLHKLTQYLPDTYNEITWNHYVQQSNVQKAFEQRFVQLGPMKHIGGGQYGEVFLCVKSGNVLKLMNVKNAEKEKDIRSILAEKEIETLKKLKDCSHVINLIDSFSIKNSKYALLMPHGGADLYKKHIKGSLNGISLVKVSTIGRQILKALKSCKKFGIIHADLKPENIFENRKGHVTIGDFGLSQRVSQPRTTDLVCSLSYRPPEEICQHPRTPALDMWSLGCIFYELLKGKPLFQVYQENPLQTDINMMYAYIRRLALKEIYPIWLQPRFMNNGKLKPSLWDQRNAVDSFKIEVIKKVGPDSDFTDLLTKMLKMEAKERITPSEALEHKFFTPLPSSRMKARTPVKFSAIVLSATSSNINQGSTSHKTQSYDFKEEKYL